MTATNTNRPKVEIQLNESVTLKLTKDKPFTGDNSRGPYFLYSVLEGNEEKAFFPTPEIHQKILEAGLKSGDQFSIKKVAVQQNGSKKIETKVEFAVVSKHNGQAPPAAGGSNGSAKDDRFQDVMEKCLREAVSATQSVNTVTWTTENITSIALTMFIQRSKVH